MCDNHELRPLTEVWGMSEADFERIALPVRCLPPLGVHEWCEHDPEHPPPTFKNRD